MVRGMVCSGVAGWCDVWSGSVRLFQSGFKSGLAEWRFESATATIIFNILIMKQIEINSEAWCSLLDEIQSKFEAGCLIPHDWLKHKFTLERLHYEDFESTEDFVKAIQMQQFAYMTLVDTLRWQLLEERSIYLKNIRGDGYTILPSKEQVKYGYDEFLKTVKVAIKQADLIMNNVLSVPVEQQAKDNDLRARCSMLKQMLLSVKG